MSIATILKTKIDSESPVPPPPADQNIATMRYVACYNWISITSDMGLYFGSLRRDTCPQRQITILVTRIRAAQAHCITTLNHAMVMEIHCSRS